MLETRWRHWQSFVVATTTLATQHVDTGYVIYDASSNAGPRPHIVAVRPPQILLPCVRATNLCRAKCSRTMPVRPTQTHPLSATSGRSTFLCCHQRPQDCRPSVDNWPLPRSSSSPLCGCCSRLICRWCHSWFLMQKVYGRIRFICCDRIKT